MRSRSVMFNTGDLGRWRDGSLEIIGSLEKSELHNATYSNPEDAREKTIYTHTPTLSSPSSSTTLAKDKDLFSELPDKVYGKLARGLRYREALGPAFRRP